MSHGAEFQISKQPAFRNLQVLQFAAQLAETSEERENVTRTGIHRAPLDDLIGRYFAVQAGVATGMSLDLLENRRLSYGSGLTFIGQATNVDYWVDYGVPVDSVVIDFENPRQIIEEEIVDEEMAREVVMASAPVIDVVRVAILEIRAAAAIKFL